jgi:hypothetical protein
MLVLCGPTYCTRLWCVWELYTLFAFSQAPPKIAVELLDSGGEGEGESEGGEGGDGAAGGLSVRPEGVESRLALAGDS